MAGSMNNNWLGISPQQQIHHHQQVSGNDDDECFDELSNCDSSTVSSLNLPPPSLPFLDAFNTNGPHRHEWNMKEMSTNSSISCTAKQQYDQETPKLENFLDNNNINYEGINNSSTMGISMIKNWLIRNNPVAETTDNINVGGDEAAEAVGGGGGQSLSLGMSTAASDKSVIEESSVPPRKSIDTFGQRTSIYRGVTRHRWTGRYEAHLWDNSCRREGQTRKGRQVYLGGYDKEDKAARAYDLAALKYWGTTTTTNFPISYYEKEIEEMKHMTRLEYVASLRRKSSGFSRGASIYRGVTRHHQHGRWQARIGRVAGNKDLYLGTFSTQEEAAEAYDIAAIKFRGLNAVTNFEINRYDVKSILESTTLPIGGAAKRLKEAENALQMHQPNEAAANYSNNYDHHWPSVANFQQSSQPLISTYPFWCKQEHHNYDHVNFLQPSSVLHNLMSLDSASSTCIDQQGSGVYNGYVGPAMGSDGLEACMFGSGDSASANYQHQQQARDLYCYQLQQSSLQNGVTKPGLYGDQGTSWIPSGVPTLGLGGRANAVAVCDGASTFNVWSDT